MSVESANNEVQQSDQSGEYYFNKGLEHMEAEQFEEAANAFTQAIKLEPEFAGSYYNLAICCVRVGNYDEAGELFEKVIEREPEFVGAYFNAGKVASLQGNYDEAVVYFDYSVKNGVPEQQALTARGVALHGCGRMREAITDFSKVLENTDDPLCLQYRANSYMAAHDFALALADIDKLVAIMPATVDVLSVKFLCLKQLGRASEAVNILEQVKEQDPDVYQALKILLEQDIEELSGKGNVIQQA